MIDNMKIIVNLKIYEVMVKNIKKKDDNVFIYNLRIKYNLTKISKIFSYKKLLIGLLPIEFQISQCK